MKKLLVLACAVYFMTACGTEVVDRRSFLSSDASSQIGEGNSKTQFPTEHSGETSTNNNPQEPIDQSLPLSTLEWNAVDVIGTSRLDVFSISRGGSQ